MKKSLALVLALVMVLSSFSFVSAAPDFADVKGTVYEDAVARLELLNVLKGYPDGTFKPEGSITRAEFAAVAVRARGLAGVAEAAKGLPSGFVDVPATHWAAGYVGTAGSMGIVNGIGNGMFAPNGLVKYEEAVTMLVRALGYEFEAQAKGGYPYGYLIVAEDIDLLDGARGTQGAFATRGLVAKLTDNALEIPMMIQDGTGKWIVSGDARTEEVNLLDYMGFDTVKGRVTAYSDSKDTIKIGSKTLDVAEDFDFYKVFGVEIKAWVDGDEVVVYKLNEEVKFDAVEYDDDEEVTLITEDENYALAMDEDDDVIATLWVDGEEVDYDEFVADYAKVVLNDDDEIIWAEGYTLDGFLLVEETDDEIAYDLNDVELDLEDFLLVKGGETIAVEDLVKGDIVFYNETEDFAVVYNMSETGEVTRVYTNDTFKLDGTTYAFAVYDDTNAMYLDGSDLDELTYTILDDMMDENDEVTVFFDFKGDVVLVVGETGLPSESNFFAVVMEDANVYYGRGGAILALDVMDKDGKMLSYDLDWDAADDIREDDRTDVAVANAEIEDLVKFYLEDDEIVAVELLDTITAPAFELDDRYVSGYRLQDSTVFFFVDDEEVVTLADADFDEVFAGAEMYVKDGKILAVIEPDTDKDEDTTDFTGLVTRVRRLASKYYEFTIEVAGEEMVFTTESKSDVAGDYAALKNKIVTLEVGDESEEIVKVTVESADKQGVVSDISTAKKTFKIGASTYELISSAVIYDEDFDIVSLRDLAEGDYVYLYMDGTSSRYVEYVVIGDAPVAPPVVDKTALNAAKTAAAALVEAEYTVASWDALEAALALAEATQAEVDAKTAAINAAIAGLVEVAPGTVTAVYTTASLVGQTAIKINLTPAAEAANVDEVLVNGISVEFSTVGTEIRARVEGTVSTVVLVMDNAAVVTATK
jgi:hypothetical protein